MKLNNKGMSLIELIVSFAIVTVAVVYFYQTLNTVTKLYKTSEEQTQEYVDKNYALRIVDAYLNKKIDGEISKLNVFCSGSSNPAFFCNEDKFFVAQTDPNIFSNKIIEGVPEMHSADLGQLLNTTKCNPSYCGVGFLYYNPKYNVLIFKIGTEYYYRYLKIDLTSATRQNDAESGLPNDWWKVNIIK